MLCVLCKKHQALPQDCYCVACDEQVYLARIESQESKREREEEKRRYEDYAQ